MRYQSCKTCKSMKPRSEPYYSVYGDGKARRTQWKHVCNDCIAAAHDKRKRRSSAPALDDRDRRHPLEEIFRKWRNATSHSDRSGSTPATPSSPAITP